MTAKPIFETLFIKTNSNELVETHPAYHFSGGRHFFIGNNPLEQRQSKLAGTISNRYRNADCIPDFQLL